MKKTSDKKARMRMGWTVIIALAALTLVEFAISMYLKPSTPYLIVTALIKAWLIVSYFMHITQIWRKEVDRK